MADIWKPNKNLWKKNAANIMNMQIKVFHNRKLYSDEIYCF